MSHLRYAVECFGLTHKKNLDQISRLQKRAIRIVANVGFSDHTKPLFQRFEALPYQDLVTYSIVLFFFNIFHGWSSNLLPVCPASSCTRGSLNRLLLVHKFRSNIGSFSILNRGVVIWNKLPVNIRSFDGSLPVFKDIVKRFLLN